MFIQMAFMLEERKCYTFMRISITFSHVWYQGWPVRDRCFHVDRPIDPLDDNKI